MTGSEAERRFQVQKWLVKGIYEQVFRVKDRASGKLFALKTFLSQGSWEREKNAMEVASGHPNIIQKLDEFEDDHEVNKFCIVTELCDGGNLQSLVKRWKRTGLHIPERLIRHFMNQAAQGIIHVHQRSGEEQLQLDIKPRNLLLTKQVQLKVADFDKKPQIFVVG